MNDARGRRGGGREREVDGREEEGLMDSVEEERREAKKEMETLRKSVLKEMGCRERKNEGKRTSRRAEG